MKYITALYNEDLLYQKIIDRNMSSGVDIEVFKKPLQTVDGWSPRITSDIDRMIRLSENPELNWIDADCIPIKEIDFDLEPGFPYMYSRGWFDPCVILGNGCGDFFKYIVSKLDINKPIEWYFSLINGELKDKIKPIPKGYYLHLALNSVHNKAKETGRKFIGYGYSVQFKKGEWDLKIY